MLDKLLNWYEIHPQRGALYALGLLVVMVVGVLGFAAYASAATVSGTVTHATKYEDGTDLGSNLKHTRIEVGTCSGTLFATKEGEALVVPPATSWSVTVPRAFGDFCVRGQSETLSGILSVYTGTAKVTKVEPKPNPPVLSPTITVAYEFSMNAWGEIKLGKEIGTIKPGSTCVDNPVWTNRGEYYEIDLANVELYGKKPKSSMVLTQCKWTS